MTHRTPTIAPKAPFFPRHGEGMGVGALAVTLLMTTPLSAQVMPTGTPAADILLSQAITEQRVFHTCSILDAQSHLSIIDLWAADAEFAAKVMAEKGVAAEAIAAFTTAASLAALLPAPGTPFEDVKQFCDAHPDWQARWAGFDVIILANDLPKAFE